MPAALTHRNETEQKEYDRIVREFPASITRIIRAIRNLDDQFGRISDAVENIALVSLGGRAGKKARNLQAALDRMQTQLKRMADATRGTRRDISQKELTTHRRELRKISTLLTKSTQTQTSIAHGLSEVYARVKRLEELYQPAETSTP